MASDFNLVRINTKQYADNLKATMKFGGNVFVAGRRGSGKTEIAKNIIKELGYEEVYLNVSTMERTDFSGYPDLMSQNKSTEFVNFLLPVFYKKLIAAGDKAIALIDEVDKVDNALQAPLLEFTQFKTMNGRKLPNLQGCIMTGNLISEGSQRPSLPLLDRAEKYLLEPNHEHWLKWAGESREIHPSITAYINDNPQDLFGEENEEDNYASASPRGWHNASKLLKFGEHEDNKWSNDLLVSKVVGCVGKKAGIKYRMYFDHYANLLPLIDKIMKSKEKMDGLSKEFIKLEKTKQVVGAMILCTRVAGIVDNRKDDDANKVKKTKKDQELELDGISRAGEFMSKTVDPEIALIAMRSQITAARYVRAPELSENEYWDKILSHLADRM